MILSLSKNKEMDTSENDQFSLKRRTSDHLNHQSSGVIPTGWLFGAPSMNMESDCPIAVGSVIPMNSSPCSSVPMVDPFIPMASNENNILRNINSVNCAPFVKSVMSSRGMFLPTIPKILTPSLSHYPADSSFIGRAAMFSCTGGNFSGMINSFDPSQTVAPCTNISKDVIGTRLQNITLHMSEAKDVSLPLNHESRSGSPIKNQINKGSSLLGVPNNDTYETNFTEGSQETNTNSADASGDSCPSDLGAKKRKRIDQNKEMVDQVQRGPSSSLNSTKESTEAKQQVELTSSKPIGKHVKDGSEVPKEDHIHVRARRGQATNSHSIAERLRRERISERMKYLQDLVPGCSKVTGKAVMLDEIINYVQSLQQQVEFLSMKLAAVTPQHNYSIEGLLAKDLHSCDGTLSVSGLPQEMIYPQLRPSQQDSLDAYRRLVNSHWTTMHNSWGEELNVMKMTNGTNPPINAPESSKPCDDFPM